MHQDKLNFGPTMMDEQGEPITPLVSHNPKLNGDGAENIKRGKKRKRMPTFLNNQLLQLPFCACPVNDTLVDRVGCNQTIYDHRFRLTNSMATILGLQISLRILSINEHGVCTPVNKNGSKSEHNSLATDPIRIVNDHSVG